MEEIIIRPIAKEDDAELYKLIEKNRERLVKYFPKTVESITDMVTARKFTRLKVRQALEREQFYFLVRLKSTSEIIGMILVKNINWTVPKGELAYFIDGKREGQGYTTIAVKWLIDYCFNTLQMEKLFIKFDPNNAASKKVAIKNGFEREGFLKREFRTGHGQLCDVERFGLVRK